MTMVEIGEALIAGSRLSGENVLGISLIIFFVSLHVFVAWICAEDLAWLLRKWRRQWWHEQRMRRLRRGEYARERQQKG